MDIFNKQYANPFNWTGSKHRYLKQMLEVLDLEANNLKVLDPFVGGGDMISKLPSSWEISAGDMEEPLIGMHQAIRDGEITVEKVLDLYATLGLGKDESCREAYLSLRKAYNTGDDTPLNLYTLMTNAFNNQLRFNKSGEYNMPFGKDRSEFNDSLQTKLAMYKRFLDKFETPVKFSHASYDDWDWSEFDLVLLDPPYRNTTATYNETGGWDVHDDNYLFALCDSQHERGNQFVYFNQTWSKGVPNEELIEWMKKYDHVVLKDTSRGCSYNRNNSGKTEEVMVFNTFLK